MGFKSHSHTNCWEENLKCWVLLYWADLLKEKISTVVSGFEFFLQSCTTGQPGRGSKHSPLSKHDSLTVWVRLEAAHLHVVRVYSLVLRAWQTLETPPTGIFTQWNAYSLEEVVGERVPMDTGFKESTESESQAWKTAFGDQLAPCYSTYGPCTSSIVITWEGVRNVESQSPPQTYWIKIYILTRSLGD